MQIKEVCARKHYAMVVDVNNQIYFTGYMKGPNEKKTLTHMPLPQDAVLETYACGRFSILALSQDQKYYWLGKNKYNHFQEAAATTDKFLLMSPESSPRNMQGGRIV